MNVFARNVAKARLTKSNAPPAEIHMQKQGDSFIIQLASNPPRTLPISGAEVQDGDLRLHLQVENDSPQVLRDIGETAQGRCENVFRIGASPDSMTLDVTVTSPQLPTPLNQAPRNSGATN